jgi:hypothetical protein
LSLFKTNKTNGFYIFSNFLTGESVSFLTTNEIFDGIFRRSIEILDADPFDG